MVVNVDGTDARAITDSKAWWRRWSPDGKAVLTDADGSLLLVPIDSGEIRTIVIVNGATLHPVGAAWSSDGRWIVFLHETSGREAPTGPLPISRSRARVRTT
jgi:Tol biopolymer transport system component